ncbi:MAG: 30S ribosomal protein S12 methylthiotransferase RimO [Solobacterium sp.]|nr:30S ribosomal protein S12 methylthiotransferase RimO [Solobacterium sp.]MBQ1383146.1 30S ribosomal protein S12 methylthiotransferase RimO [Solobacterium sp.]MBQ1446814.1 30S ribosomal protein S12 methylthiotransferase RimO [Solobacterium sp.]
MKIGVISLGCAKNLVDTEYLLGLLRESGQEIVQDPQEAEAVIINTCGFIQSAKEEAIRTIFDVLEWKEHGVDKVIVMGCLAKRYKPELEAEIPEVDRFVSIDEYGQLGSIIGETLGIPVHNTYGKAPRILSGKPWMAYLRIAEGCDNRCAYCAIPLIRGPLVSVPMDRLVKEAQELAAQGVKELTLIAQDTSRYGYDTDRQLHLSELLKKLDAIDGFHWIRILYMYPDEIPDDLIETIQHSRHILPYFDIPVQHGCDDVLKAMHRRSNAAEILDRTSAIRAAFAHPVLRTTLICGFPGETLAQHEENLELMRKVRWDHLGAFTYSPEEGTASFAMEDDVPEEEKKRRLNEIMDLQDEIVKEDRVRLIGEEAEVLVEEIEPLTGMYLGRSAMFAPDAVDGWVRFRSEEALEPGTFCRVRYTRVSGQSLLAEYLEKLDV